ncbi:MAG: hypothetical protein WCX65_16190 [bacterium]
MPLIEAKAYKHLLTVLRDDAPVFDMPYQIVVNGLVWFADRVEVNGLRIEAHIGETLISDTIEPHGQLLCITRRWSLRGSFDARVLFTVFRAIRPERWFTPGAICASGPDLVNRSISTGPIREESTTIPGCSVLESNDWTFGVFTQPAESVEELSTIATHISTDYSEFNISLPGVPSESQGRPRKAQAAEWDVDGQITYERRFYIWSRPLRDGGWQTVFNTARELTDFEPEPPVDHGEILRAKTRHLIENFFIERNDAVGFVESVGSSMFPKKPWLLGGGPGGNIEAARTVYRVGRATDDRNLKRIALDTADFFLSDSEIRKKMAFDYFLPRRRWNDSTDDNNFNQKVGEFIKSAVLLHFSAGNDANPRWIYTCKQVADTIFEKWRKRDASIDPSDSASVAAANEPRPDEAFLADAFAALFRASRDKRYLESAEWLGDRAISTLTACIAPGSAETAISRDAARAMLRLFIQLYEETGRAEYIESANRAADYINSLIYSYNTVIPARSRLNQEAFRTAGGVLPAHGVTWLDPCSSSVALDFLCLWKHTHDERLRRRAIGMINFASQIIAHSASGIGLLHSFEGCQPERFFHSGDPRSPGAWGAVSAGAASCVPAITSGSLLDIKEQFPDVLCLTIMPVEPEKSLRSSISHALLAAGCFIKVFSTD